MIITFFTVSETTIYSESQFILYDKQAILNKIQVYQEYINLLIYSANILHINIAYSISFLA